MGARSPWSESEMCLASQNPSLLAYLCATQSCLLPALGHRSHALENVPFNSYFIELKQFLKELKKLVTIHQAERHTLGTPELER